MTMDQQTTNQQGPVQRAVGFELARELTEEELNTVSGGTIETAAYTPTGKPESDCD